MMELLYQPVHRSHSLVTLKSALNQSINDQSSPMDQHLMQEKYKRLLESHHRLIRVNQNLEDKLLRVVTTCEEQKNAMKSEVETLTEQLEFFKSKTDRLEQENAKYREDCLLAIQLLKCNPTNYNEQNVHTLPSHVRSQVSAAAAAAAPSNQNAAPSVSGRPTQVNGSYYESDDNPETPEVQIFQSFFPPNAVVVPTRRNNNNRDSQCNGHKNSPRVGPQHVSAESVADILQKDLSIMHYDIRARPSSSSVKERGGTGKVFDI